MPTDNTELTVEQALAELRETFPKRQSAIEFSTRGFVSIFVYDGDAPYFRKQATLTDAMAQVRNWKAKQ